MLLLYINLLLLIVHPGDSVECPKPFTDLGLDEHRCYYVSNTSDVRDWTSAYTHCQDLHKEASLLSVPDPVHYYPIPYQMKQKNVTEAWTGLFAAGGEYSWADGSPFNDELKKFIVDDARSSQNNWFDYMISLFTPRTSKIFGFISTDDSQFHFGDAKSKRPYICKLDLVPPTQPPSTTSVAPPTSTTEKPLPCTPPWVEDNGYCYLYSGDSAIWSGGIHGCYSRGGAELVSIPDSDTLLFLLVRAPSEEYWIGLQENNGTFIWADGADASQVEETFGEFMDEWVPDKECFRMNPTVFPLYLQHTNCFESHKYLCYVAANKTDVYY